MNQDANQVMAPGLQTKELHIKKMGDPRDRMPASRVTSGSGPRQAGPGNTFLNMRIGSHVQWIVITNEVILNGRKKNPDD